MSVGEELRFDFEVEGVEGVLAVIDALREDLESNPEDWENGTLDRYLEGLAASIRSLPSAYTNLGVPEPRPDRRFLADALRAARIYE